MGFFSNTKHTFWCNLNSADRRVPRGHKITNSELALCENNYFHWTVDFNYILENMKDSITIENKYEIFINCTTPSPPKAPTH